MTDTDSPAADAKRERPGLVVRLYRDPALRYAGTVWLVQLVLAVLVVAVFTNVIHHGPLSERQLMADWFRGFAAWDGGWYLGIAKHGYASLNHTAFFPLYPVLVGLLSSATGMDGVTVGFLISNVTFLAALWLLYRLASDLYDDGIARKTVFLTAVFPTAFFFNAVYTESITLLATVAFFYLLQRERWYAAIAVVAIATSSKQLIVLIGFAALLHLFLHRGQLSRRTLVLRFLSLAFIPLGLFIYMAYLWKTFDNPFAFITAQENWYRVGMVPVWSALKVMLGTWLAPKATIGDWNYALIQLVNGALTIAFTALAVLAVAWRRAGVPAPMALFALLTIAVATLSSGGGDLNSYGRYMAVMFPIFFLLARGLRNETAYQSVICLFLTFKVILLGMFCNGYWVT